MPPCFSAAHLKENKKISINLYRPFPSGERRYCFTDLPLFLSCAGNFRIIIPTMQNSEPIARTITVTCTT